MPDLSEGKRSFKMSHYQPVTLHYAIDLELRAAGQQPLTESQETELRGTLASMGWAARQARPDLSASASILASAFPNPVSCRSAAMHSSKLRRAGERQHLLPLLRLLLLVPASGRAVGGRDTAGASRAMAAAAEAFLEQARSQPQHAQE